MKRILFVDDEPNILDGLKRMLRSQRKVWHMAFTTSGAEALSVMADEPFDVIVTDMKMPGMNGAELLQRVQDEHPRTIRFVLSGHADLEASLQSIAVSHQFLSKPCEAGLLKSVVERACGLDDLLQQQSLRRILGTITELPVLPEVYQALTKALGEEEVDIQEIGSIVEQDIGIAAKILQLVNSSFFGYCRDFTDLRDATAYLGVNTIRDLVLTFAMFRQFEGSAVPAGFSIARVQSHSLLTSRIARRLLSEKKVAEQAFLAAMLHDVGKLILMTCFAEPFETIIKSGAGSKRPFHEVEEEVIGVSHAEIGAYLLALWGMPYPVVEAVAHHHHPTRVLGQTELGVLGATHVADALAQEQDGNNPATFALDEEYLETLGVLGKLPEWRAIAAEEAGGEKEAA